MTFLRCIKPYEDPISTRLRQVLLNALQRQLQCHGSGASAAGMELELRLGRIESNTHVSRAVVLGVSTSGIMDAADKHLYRFNTEIDANQYILVLERLSAFTHLRRQHHKLLTISFPANERRRFSVSSVPTNSSFLATCHSFISKEKIESIDVVCPSWPLDLRVTLSREAQLQPQNIKKKESAEIQSATNSDELDEDDDVRIVRSSVHSFRLSPYLVTELKRLRRTDRRLVRAHDSAAAGGGLPASIADLRQATNLTLCLHKGLPDETYTYQLELEVDMPTLSRDWLRLHGNNKRRALSRSPDEPCAFLSQVSHQILSASQFLSVSSA